VIPPELRRELDKGKQAASDALEVAQELRSVAQATEGALRALTAHTATMRRSADRLVAEARLVLAAIERAGG
jgi:hypothetical protein